MNRKTEFGMRSKKADRVRSGRVRGGRMRRSRVRGGRMRCSRVRDGRMRCVCSYWGGEA